MWQAIRIILISFFYIRKNSVYGDKLLPKENWQGAIHPYEGSLIKHVAETKRQYSIITWTYDIILPNYNDRDPHPYIFLHQEPRFWEYVGRKGNCLHLMIYVEQDPRLVYLTEDTCTLRGEDLYCSGELKHVSASDETWQATFAYDCNHHLVPPLDVTYNITLTPYETITCQDTKDIYSFYELPPEILPMTNRFAKLYDKFSPWNFFAFDKALIHRTSTLYPLLGGFTCYQHTEELLGRLIFPECRDGKVIFQCTEMCDDFRAGCGDNILMSYSKGCLDLNTKALNEPCVYKPVTCQKEPIAPENGYVSGNGEILRGANRTFSCDSGYTLVGNNTAVCDYSGNWWIEEYPQCAEKNETIVDHKVPVMDNSLLIPLCVVGGFVIILLVAGLIIYTQFRYEVIILIFKYCRCLLCCSRFNKIYSSDKRYDAFIAYHEDDEGYVKRNIEVPLDTNGFKIFVDYRDGPLGQPIVRYAPEAIAQSHAVILLISQQFLDDGRCTFLLDQAFFQTMIGEQFKVIIVLMEEQKKLKNIPRYLKGFMATGSNTIQKDDPQLVTKLSYNLPQRQTISTEQELPAILMDDEDSEIGRHTEYDIDKLEQQQLIDF